MVAKMIKLEGVSVFLLIVLILAIFPIWQDAIPIIDWNQAGIWLLVPTIFVIFLVRDIRFRLTFMNREFVFFIALFIWGSAVSIAAINEDLAFSTQRRLFLVVLFSYPILSYGVRSRKNAENILVFFVVEYVITLMFFFILGEESSSRFSEEKKFLFDRNSYSYHAFAGIICLCMLAIKFNRLNRFQLLFLISVSICTIFMVVETASRGGAVIISFVLLLAGPVVLNRAGSLSGKKVIRMFFLFGIISFVSVLSYEALVPGSILERRFDSLAERTSPRQRHFFSAAMVGINNPILGVGGGNYAVQPRDFEPGSFSHNGFTEVLASYGVLGLILYLLVIFGYLRSIIRLYLVRTSEFRVIGLHAIYLAAFVAYNFLYVPYLAIIFMSVFFAMRLNLHHELNRTREVRI